MSPSNTRVSIVEDLDEVRLSLRAAIDEADGLQCLNDYATGEAALSGLLADPPDVVVMDIGLPGINGIECMLRVKLKNPDIRFMMFTIFDKDEQVFEALKAGADGYILKHEPFDEILSAIREVHAGGAPMSRHIARKVMRSFHRLPQPPDGETPLTPRETEVLEKLSKGWLYKEIADNLDIKLGTVKQHIHKIYKKLHVQNRTEAINKYHNLE